MKALKKEKFVFVNALRGIAALLVVIFHLQIHVFFTEDTIPRYSLTWWLVLGFFDLGKYAVALFFMVSGFLIPATLRGPSASLKKFAIHRFFRLYPAYWFSILFFFLAYRVMGEDAIFPLPVILLNLTMLQKFFGKMDIIGVFWTLQIELIFYFLCVFLFAIKRLNHQLTVLWTLVPLGLAAAAVRFVTYKQIPVAIFLALLLMFLGDTLRAYREGTVRKAQVHQSLALVLVSIVPICYLGYQKEFLRYLLTYYSAIATFYVSFLNAEKFSNSPLICRISNFIGDISYGVYLTGAVLQVAVARFYYAQYGNKYVATVLLLTAVILLSFALYRWLEQPCIRFGRKLTTPRS